MWFLTSVIVKLIERDLPVLQTVFLRSTISIVLVAAAGWLSKSPVVGDRTRWPKLFLRGFTGTMTWICVYGSLFLIPLGDSLALLFSSSALVALSAWLLRLDRDLRWFTVLGVGCSVLGVIFITRPPFLFGGEEWTFDRMLGLLLGLSSTVSITGSFLLVRFIGTSEGALTITAWNPFVSILVSVVPLALGFPQQVVWNLRLRDYYLVALCAVTAVCAQLLNTRGTQLSSATLASTVNSMEVVLGRLADVTIFQEAISPLAMVGTVLSFLGAVTVALGRKPSRT